MEKGAVDTTRPAGGRSLSHEIYKRHRPRELSRVVGNEETVEALSRMIEKKKVPHTILFSGPSGCGKTSLARIVARALDCSEMDLQEMNCSSERGIDTIRKIKSVMSLSPIGGKCRVWILDEFHQTTRDAQDAALKMMEDTPDHVYFFLCTTDPQKLIPTIRSRCTDMPVRLLTYKELTSLVSRVARKEAIELDDKVRDELCDLAAGGARKALVLLDKIRDVDPRKQIEAMQVKSEEEQEAIDLCRALLKKKKWSEVSKILRELKGEPESIRWAVLGYARAILLSKGDHQAYVVIGAFENHFYDSKQAGLARAAYEAIHG